MDGLFLVMLSYISPLKHNYMKIISLYVYMFKNFYYFTLLYNPVHLRFYLLRISQKATALAAATFKESQP